MLHLICLAENNSGALQAECHDSLMISHSRPQCVYWMLHLICLAENNSGALQAECHDSLMISHSRPQCVYAGMRSCYWNTSLHRGGCFHQDGVAPHEDIYRYCEDKQ